MDKIKKLLFKQQKSLLSENNTKELEKFKNFWLKNYNRAGIFDTPKQNFEDLFQVKPNGRILFGGVVVLDDLKKLIKELSTYSFPGISKRNGITQSKLLKLLKDYFKKNN